MPDRQTSRTAFGTASLRAAHQLLDTPSRILDDPVIVTLLGRQAVETITGTPEAYQTPERRALRANLSTATLSLVAHVSRNCAHAGSLK